MAYSELSTGQVDANSPLDTTLFQQIRTNQIEFNSRLSGQLVYVQSTLSTTFNFNTTAVISPSSLTPQVDEGFQVLTAVITPQSSSNRVIIDYNPSRDQGHTVALFQDSGASAIAGAGLGNPLRHIIDPIGTTAASTFSIRVTKETTVNPAVFFNRSSDSTVAFYGGMSAPNMTITEIATT